MAHVTNPRSASLRASRGVLLSIALFGAALWLVAAIRSIWVDPVVADTSEHAQTAEELATIAKIEKEALFQIKNAAKPDHLTKRDAHPAPHGCVQAYFRVRDDLPEALRHGVLAQPGHVYPAWVRLSNGVFSDDNELDARGMAIKLMEVPGEKLLPAQKDEQTQDFVMINNSTFPIANVEEYLTFFTKQVEGDSFGYFVGFNPFAWHLREMRVGFGMLKRPANPLSAAYFSMLPFKLGPDLNIKFSVLPCDPDEPSRCQEWKLDVPDARTSHYLRDALVETLTPKADAPESNGKAARFAFRVQVQNPALNMPIEDASIVWSEQFAPYQEVAEISIPAQRFSTEEQNEFCENLSFTPWHALPAHRPIGGLNRARRRVYELISATRHAANGVARHEPRGFCLRLDGQPCSALAALGDQP
jgi:hypothetical protein